MNQRPKSITIVCWFLIISAGISLVTSTLSLNNPITRNIMAKSLLSINIQYIIMYSSLVISIVCGIAMLKGQNWARLLYIAWQVIGSIIGIAASPMKALMIPGIIIFLRIAFFLFRPKANEYFKITETA